MNDCMTQEDAMKMNNAQAIQILKPMQKMMIDQYGCPVSDAYFALGKAIESLKTNAFETMELDDDTISRQAAIEALWKSLYEYEDKTEKQFQESEDLDVGDWINHRNFVQNMNDIDRQTILNLPSAQQWIPCSERLPEEFYVLCCDNYGGMLIANPFECDDSDTGFSAESDECYMYNCIAWIPLPEPYKGEE